MQLMQFKVFPVFSVLLEFLYFFWPKQKGQIEIKEILFLRNNLNENLEFNVFMAVIIVGNVWHL